MTDKFDARSIVNEAEIELHLTTIEQLFNSLDPSPFHERDLDAEAERYLVGRAREIGRKLSLRLIVTVSKPTPPDNRSQHIPEAIHGHFSYRALQAKQELRMLVRTGWIALVIGLFVLATCLLAIQYLDLAASGSSLGRLAEQSLLLLGWVANWRPLEIFLYDWWPIWRHRVLLQRLAKMPVEIRIVEPSISSLHFIAPRGN